MIQKKFKNIKINDKRTNTKKRLHQKRTQNF